MDKASQRRSALARRAALSGEERREYSEIICRELLQLPELKNARVILSYMAAGDEADIKLFNDEVKKQGKTLCLPVSHSGGIMEAYCPGGLKRGRFGITEPDTESSYLILPEEIELIIAPCVAFDEQGMRLGHGCGYYDRYLPACKNAPVIAAAFEAQRLEKLCTGKFDRKLDACVSEKKVYRF